MSVSMLVTTNEDLWSLETCDEHSQGPNCTVNSTTDYSHNGNILLYNRLQYTIRQVVPNQSYTIV